MTTILQQAMSPEVLDISWRRLRNEHTPWSIEINRDQLQQHLLRTILNCREQVLNGRYRPQPMRQFPMRKPDGRQRIISAQYLQDKLVQRTLLTVLEPKAEAIFHEDSFAYRPNRSVAMALNRVRERVRVGQVWLVDADICHYFDSIPHKPLAKLLKVFVGDADAMKLIERWLKHGAHQSSILRSRRGISQGAILSPLFCNLYLHQFDLALARANIPFVRFADDFLLFGKTREQAENVKAYAEKQLCQLGLKFHPDKTQIVKSNPGVIFLGEKLPKAAE